MLNIGYLLFLMFILVFSCSPSTGPDSDYDSHRDQVTVSGAITEDTVWEQGKDYLVMGDVTVEEGATSGLFSSI